MLEVLQRILKSFEANGKAVLDLVTFDQAILDIAVKQLESLRDKLKMHHMLDNPQLSADSTLRMFQNIRKNNSLSRQYRDMYNQGVVLLVSHFGSAVGDVFRNCLVEGLRAGKSERLKKVSLEFSLDELKNMDFDIKDQLGEIVVNKKDISFQDMQSIANAFETYFNFRPPKDENTNTIILGQASRHVIVHNSGKVDRRMIGQVSNALPRALKNDLKVGAELSFSLEELEKLKISMSAYLKKLEVGVVANWF
jgi:hypothetical protein